MWERWQLKERAKSVLKGSYWKAFLVSIVMGIGSGRSVGSFRSSSSRTSGGGSSSGIPNLGNLGQMDTGWLIAISVIIIAVIVGLIIGLAVRILIGYNLEVGGTRYFTQAARDDVNMGYLGYGFTNKRYTNIIKTMFWKDLFVFLWSLLFIIPGVIKSYAYSMVPYILADNPEIGHKRALELSQQMTQGHKFNIWVLELSFLGWYFLGALLCGIGVIFVAPYQNATKAELYLVLREKAVENGWYDYDINLIEG